MIFSFIFHNWRFNPFKEDLSDALNPATITDEEHIIVWDEDAKIYLIRLHEAPQFDNPSSMTIMEDTIEYEEVPRGTGPATEQYRVDYDADTFFGTGIIEFNSVDVGKTVKVSYQGLGTVVKNRYQLKQISILPTNVGIEGNLQVQDNLIVDEDFSLGNKMISNLDMGQKRLLNPSDPISSLGVGDRDYGDRRYEFKLEDYNFDIPELWALSDANARFTTDGTNGKAALTFVADSAIHSASFLDSNGNLRLFPVMEGGATNGIIRAKRTAVFNHHLIIRLDFYDKDRVLIATDNNRFFNAELKIDEYSMMTFGSNSGTTNAAYYTLEFLINANATAGIVDIDFWRIGNNIGYSEAQIRHMLPAGQRGAYGAPLAAKWSGKGFIVTIPSSLNIYSVSNNGDVSLSNIIIDGTERFKYQITYVWAELSPIRNRTYIVAVNAASGGFSYVLSEATGSSDDVGPFFLIPIFDYDTQGRAIIRLWESSNPVNVLIIHAFFVN